MVNLQIRALLVEDNPFDALLLQETLDSENVEIFWAERLSDGLAKLASESFDIVLLDLSLPDSKELDSLKKIRQNFPHIPIVILTGLDDRAIAIDAVKNGAQDYLVKGRPSAESMFRCMRYSIERQHSEDQIRKSAAEAREAQSKLELALAASQIGVYSWDVESNVLNWDQRINEICGLQPDAKDLKLIQERIVEEDCQKVRDAISATLSGMAEYDVEFRVQLNDGTIRRVSSKGKTFFDSEGKPTKLTGVLRDITREVAVQEHERRLAVLEQREEFIAMLAHDLRNPVHGAQRLIGLMIGGSLGALPPVHVDILTKISASNKNMLQSISNILEVYRFDSGYPKPVIVPSDLSSIFRSCVEELEPIAQSKDVVLNWSSKVRNVLIDDSAFSRVITNLVSNAIKFSKQGGRVEITATARNGKAVIQVTDDGIGISPSCIDRIFNRFYQSKSSNRGQGIGLGLYLCRCLVEAQNGTISCSSVVNKGTTFEIIMPLAEVDVDEYSSFQIVDSANLNQLV